MWDKGHPVPSYRVLEIGPEVSNGVHCGADHAARQWDMRISLKGVKRPNETDPIFRRNKDCDPLNI